MATSRRLGIPAALGFVLLGAMLVNCGATEEQLRSRSAIDLNCPQTQIQMTQIDERTMGVRGCGQRAVYVESCDGPKGGMATECTWVLNSDTKPNQRVPAQ
jgi:hypothetical protein